MQTTDKKCRTPPTQTLKIIAQKMYAPLLHIYKKHKSRTIRFDYPNKFLLNYFYTTRLLACAQS